jgi:hypothetical protein
MALRENIFMQTKRPALMPLISAATALLCCALPLSGQTPPTITTQPTSQTNLAGSNVTFSVAVAGTSPFTYQWQFNGANLPNGIISTVAGGGSGGDGGSATNAYLVNPSGVAVDRLGNLYISDPNGQVIHKVDTNGIITTVAGNGAGGYSGDNGAATNAKLFYPRGVAVDCFGNLYVADTYNQRIRMVATNGIITTVAGTNVGGYFGDGGAATNAILNLPDGVGLDAFGGVYIADTQNDRIREVSTNGIITTVAGTNGSGYTGDGGAATNARLYYPSSVAVDSFGNLYVADTSNHRIRKVSTNGIITAFGFFEVHNG